MKSRVHPKYKTKYRVRNWASYERALIDLPAFFGPAIAGEGRQLTRSLT